MNNDKDNATLYAELEAERFMTDQISLLHEAEDLADGINFMLKSIGEFTDADRAYVFETSENHTFTNTYEWCAAGVTPQIRNLHDIPFESMPKWIEVFLHGENILIEDLEAYRESMPLEYELLKVQNVSTLIAFPISVHEKLIGFVGVDNPDMEKSSLIHRLLSLLGKYVGTMIKDHKNEQMRLEVVASKSRLDYQLEMDEILRGAQIGIWTLEMDGVKAPRLHPNPTMCTLLGVSQEMSPEEVYQFWYHRIPPKYVTPVLDYIQKVIHESYSEITYPWNHPLLGQIPFDIREILDNCWSMLEAQASRLDITLKKIKPGSLKYPYLIGSPLHIRQIFMNLLSNAIKYNKPGGSISVHAKIIRQVHQNVIYKFIISDTGIGISPEFQKHIFEPFAQEDTGARTIYKGTGLGMAIVHRLVQEMGGTIQLKSEKNVGSTFTLILPFTIDEHQPSASAETATDTPADLTDLHILVVEDNELNLEIAVFSLEAAGLNVSTAINGLEAVRLFEKSKPYEYDIILMDIMMPVMNGLDAAKAIRGLSRPDATTVPIIALSANAFAEDIQKSKNAGINEHLAKPLEMDKMLKVIASYCK